MSSGYSTFDEPSKASSTWSGLKARARRVGVYRETRKLVAAGEYVAADGSSISLLASDAHVVRHAAPTSNILRLPCYKGPNLTTVKVVSGEVLQGAVDCINNARMSSTAPALMEPFRSHPDLLAAARGAAGVPAAAGAGGVGGAASGGSAAADGDDEPPPAFKALSPLALQARPNAPVYVCMADPTDVGGTAYRGSMNQEAELARRSNLVAVVEAATKTAKEAAARKYGLVREEELLYPFEDCGGLYASSISVFRSGQQRGYATLEVPTQMAVVMVPPLLKPATKPSVVTKGELVLHPDARQVLFCKVWTQFRIALAHHHSVVVVPPFSCDVGQTAPPDQVARVYGQVLQTHFAGCFQEIRFVIPADLPKAAHAFSTAFNGNSGTFRTDVSLSVPAGGAGSFGPPKASPSRGSTLARVKDALLPRGSASKYSPPRAVAGWGANATSLNGEPVKPAVQLQMFSKDDTPRGASLV